MKNTKTILTLYHITDEVADKLQKDGYKIICISYGYQNFYDLIIYEVA